MPDLRLTVLGVGDAFSALYYSTSFLVEGGGQRWLIDCPHPIRKILRESGCGLDLPDIDGVVLTHLHGDHVSGLEGLAFFDHFVMGRRTQLITHPAVARRLWSDCLSAGMDGLLKPDGGLRRLAFEDYFALTPLTLDAPVAVGGLAIDARMTRHHVPTCALRVRAGGASLGYSADTSFDRPLIDWLAAAQAVIHETNLGAHTPLDALVALPEALRAKLRLVHYPDGFDAARSPIPCLRQGDVIDLDAPAPRP